MKGYLLDFGLVEDPQKFTGISDQAFRTLGENEMILQMFSQKIPSISIGYDDTKAPHFKEGVEHYRSKGLKVGIRGAGGRSVANDEGILNFSILFKSQEPSHAQYVFFHKFIQDALKPLGLNFDLGEVTGAYCPGTYDISIDGKKVAGTASRQVKDNTLVGCYLGVNGDQYKRSKVISEFYEITKDVIRVDTNKLTTIEDQLDRPISVQEVKDLLIAHFKTITDSLENYDISKISQEDIDASVKRMSTYSERYL